MASDETQSGPDPLGAARDAAGAAGERLGAARDAAGKQVAAARENAAMAAHAAAYKLSQKPRLRGVSHQWAFFVSLGAGAALILAASGTTAVIAMSIYAFSLSAMLGTSALYHRVTWTPEVRQWTRRLDHTMIFVFIAGTYTPFALLVMHGTLANVVLIVVWATALGGLVLNLVWITAPYWVSTVIYLSTGWAAVVSLPQLWIRVTEALALRRQLRLLGRVGRHLLDLGELVAVEIEVALAAAVALPQLGQLGLETRALAMRLAVGLAQGQVLGAGKAVEHLHLRRGNRQPAVLVLAIEGEQPPSQQLQVGGRGGPARDEGRGPTRGRHPAPEDDLLRSRRQPFGDLLHLRLAEQPGGRSKTPSTQASSAPGRTIRGRALPPISRSSEWASTVLPAPVSPVIAFSPSPSRNSAFSMSSRFSIRSSRQHPLLLAPGAAGPVTRGGGVSGLAGPNTPSPRATPREGRLCSDGLRSLGLSLRLDEVPWVDQGEA